MASITSAVGLSVGDLFEVADAMRRDEKDTEYAYRDAAGALLFEVLRSKDKRFRQRRPDGNGGWIWNTKGVSRQLYRLPELLAADPEAWVFVVEGEKDADRLASLGLVATTNPNGAGQWRQEYAEALRGRRVAIIPDNDDIGRGHAADVARSLDGIAADVVTVELPDVPAKGDVSDYLEAGGTPQGLLALVLDANADVSSENECDATDAAFEEANPFPGMKLMTLNELRASTPTERRYLVDGLLLVGGVSLLVARPKVGKSTFARNVAVAVSEGRPLLGMETTAGDVLYFALEEIGYEIVSHFERMGCPASERIRVVVGAIHEADPVTAIRWAIERYRPNLVIIDPMLKAVRMRDANDYSEATFALEPVIEMARELDCHVMLVHHQGKGDRGEGYSHLGSTAIFGAVDTGIELHKADGKRTIETTQRYGQAMEPTLLEFDEATGVVSLGASKEADRIESVKREALLVIEAADGLDREAICAAVKSTANKAFVAQAVKALVEEGRIEKAGNGKRGDPFVYRGRQTQTPTVSFSAYGSSTQEERGNVGQGASLPRTSPLN